MPDITQPIAREKVERDMKKLVYWFGAVVLTAGSGFAASHGWQAPIIAPAISYAQTVAAADREASVIQAAKDTAIRPFRVKVPEAELTELRQRLAATRWPETETVTDHPRACNWRPMQAARALLGEDYDWRKCEAKLKALPKFITEIDGLDIHFIHVRSKHQDALPLIVTHGWPGSIVEQLKIIDPLTNPTAHGASASDAFHLVIPSMPGYGYSGKPTDDRLGPRAHRAGLGRADEAPRIHRSSRKAAIGVRSSRSRWVYRRLRSCSAFISTCPAPFRPKLRRRSQLAPRRLRPLRRRKKRVRTGGRLQQVGYAILMGTRPQTLTALRIHRSAWRPG